MLQSFDQNLDLKKLLDNKEITFDQCIQTEEGIMLIESKSAAPKYIDPATRKIAEQIMNNDQLKHIFESIVKLTPSQIEVIYNMVNALDNKKPKTVPRYASTLNPKKVSKIKASKIVGSR